MWTELLITGTLASAAGGLAAPAARRWMLGDIKKDWLAGELELDRIDADGQTVWLKGGAVFRVFKFAGVAYDAKVMEQQELMLKGNAALGAECEATIELLSEGNTTVFHTQLQIIVGDGFEANLNNLVQSVCEILGHRRVLYSIETDGAPICWFNRIPKGTQKRLGSGTRFLRPLTLREQNIAALWAFNNSPTGLMKSPLGGRPVHDRGHGRGLSGL